jgi:hypothetical protein
MYGRGADPIVGILPNTSGSKVLFVTATIALVVGVVIIATTVARMIIKKTHKA